MSEPLTPPVCGSMKQCQAIYGIPVSVQKAAKSAGCHAFDDHARVRPELLTQFLFKEGNEELSSKGPALERLNAARAAREEIRLQKDRKEMVSITEEIAALSKAISISEMQFDKYISVDFPPDGSGLSPIQIKNKLVAARERYHGRLRAILDGLVTAKAEFQKMGEEEQNS